MQGKSRIINHDETLAVERKVDSYYDSLGRPVAGDTVQFQITCNVQPLEPDQLLLQPEGDRNKEQWNVWVQNREGKTRLRLNDIVSRGGRRYQVQDCDDWGSYSKARITAIDIGPDRNPWPY